MRDIARRAFLKVTGQAGAVAAGAAVVGSAPVAAKYGAPRFTGTAVVYVFDRSTGAPLLVQSGLAQSMVASGDYVMQARHLEGDARRHAEHAQKVLDERAGIERDDDA